MGRIAIVGAGITGLTAAFRLQEAGRQVTLFEAKQRCGGIIRSDRRDGFLVEAGPQSLLEKTPAVARFIEDLGLARERVYASPAARRRYIVKNGELVPLPDSLGSFLSTPILSARGKARLLLEPFIRARCGDEEESVTGFVERRLGPEVLDFAVDPFVGGIFAGDPSQLSVDHAFPFLSRAERDHGSLFRGRIAEKKARKAAAIRPRLFSFTNGLGMLPAALEAKLGSRIRLGARVTRIVQGEQWAVEWVGDDGSTACEAFDEVLLCPPAHALPAIARLDGSEAELTSVRETTYSPVAVLALGFRRSHVLHPLDGYGALTPTLEKLPFLGISFVSTTFSNRAPDDRVLLHLYTGGARSPELASLDPDRLLQKILPPLGELLGLVGSPCFTHHVAWPRGIPQYNVGHGDRLGAIKRLEQDMPGLFFAGNYRHGISIADCIEAGLQSAARLGSISASGT